MQTSPLPTEVVELLDVALVAELTVVTPSGRPVSYPLIPLWDGEHILFTSAVLFSRKLEHIRPTQGVGRAQRPGGDARRAVRRAVIQGDRPRARTRRTRTPAGSGCCRCGGPRSR